MKELKDAKGFRSRYINDLNRAVKANRVVGGDVTPIESEAGTLLRITQRNQQFSFQLFSGIAPAGEEGSLVDTVCVSDGAFYVNGILEKLENGTNAIFCESGIRPRSTGWASKGCLTASSWSECEVVILKYGAQYFLAFRYDSSELYPLISDELTADAEANIELLYTIGRFRAATLEIVQNVKFDIFYTTEKSKELQPWQIVKRGEDYYAVDCEWEVESPRAIPDGVNEPSPKEIGAFKDSWSPAFEEGGHSYYRIQDIGNLQDDNFVYAYATLWSPGYASLQLSEKKYTESPACALIAIFNRQIVDGVSVITSFSQRRTGIFHSRWEETEPFFIQSLTGSGYQRLTEAPRGLPEGTTMSQYTFWKMATTIDNQPYRESEFIKWDDSLSDLQDEQLASPRGSFVWRYALHWSAQEKAIMIDSETTAFTNIPADIYAREMPQPFVEKIEVVYPESPLEQGSVDAVGGEIRILQVGEKVANSKRLFATESIDTTDGSLIETV